MAEPRRVQLSSVSSTARLQPPSPKKPHMEEPDSETSVAATVRIALTLFEPDQKKCPEFFYPELMRKLQRNEKRAEKLDKKPPDPFSNEDAERKEVEALSKKFEEKYGKKRRRDRVQDLVDMGYGYDESDSFIDNSEAYDELVPASLTTKYGGFYINTGTLQFRQASESEDESVREKKKKKSPKKMKERGDKVKKRKREEEKKSKKSKYSKPGFTALNGTKDRKKKKLMANLQEMLARFERDKKVFEKWTPTVTATTTAPKTSASTAPSLPPPPPREAEPAPDPLLSTMVPESKLLQAANAFTEKKLESPDPTPEKRSGSPPGEGVKEEFKKPPSVPEGLPPAIEKKIKELAKWVQVPDGDKKIKLFSPQMNTALLDIYLQSRDLSSGQRSSVFSHLSSILPCSKDMLVRWTSRLYLQKKGERLREPLRKLKEAVARAMPEQIVKYHAELKVHNEARYAKMLSEDKEKEQKTLSEEEEEEDKGSKKAAGPRKKFQWSEEIRQLLCQLVRMKVDIYEPGGCGMSSLEDYLKSFLDEEVRPLWPRGWMQARTLFRETRRVYPQLSSMMAKNKTVIPPKIRAKESSNKQDKNTPGPSTESQGLAVTTTRDSPASVVSAGGSPVSADTQDNSLDGDLIHNPPSLDGVSEHLTALSGRSSGLVFEFPALSKSSGSEKPTMVVEEKKKPCPPVSAASTLQPSARPVFHKKFMATGSEKKMMPQVPSPKPAPEAQQKQKAPSPAPAKTQATSPIVQPSVNVYQMSNQAAKGSFTHPIQSGGAKVSAPSPSQQPLAPQTKPVKPQGIPPSSSPSGSTHKPVAPSGFIVKSPSNPGLVGAQVYRGAINRLPTPPHGNTGGQKPTTTLNQPPTSTSRNPTTTLNQPPTSTSRNPTTTLNQPPSSTSRNPTTTLNQPPTSTSRNLTITLTQLPSSASRNPTTTLNQPPTSASRNPTTTLNQPPTSASRNPTTTLNQPPSSTSRSPTTTLNQPPTSASRNATTISAKKPPPQKLTLMAPQTSGGGTQGVAKLLTSSMVAGGGNASSNVNSQKVSAAPGLLGPAPLTILTSSYKQNGVRMPAPAALGLLSPINTFPLHVVSFTTEPPPKARASKDAIVTGPAPGTFNHGLPRSILSGLHTSTGHPSTPIPHQTLSGHMQPAQTDGAHSKGTVPSQIRPGRPNNP